MSDAIDLEALRRRAIRAGIEDAELANAGELELALGRSAREISKYPVDPLPVLLQQRQELNWIIEHWIEAGTLVVLVGPEASFKSFLAVDWCMAIATGRKWHGCRVKQGRVLYIAGEGRTGVIRRMRGWCSHYKAVPDDLFLGRSPIELIGPADAERIAELGRFDFVVVDTLARNFGPGNENDQKDMSAAVKNADHIREATGATVMLIHHAPLDGRAEGKLRPRGSSALPGAADAIFTCQYDKSSKVVKIASTKQKDAPNPESRYLSFDEVELDDTDNFGNRITTVVLSETHKRPKSKKKPTGKNQRRLIRELCSRANGSPELLVSVRDITGTMEISRQARSDLEQWFGEQPWARPVAGGHIVDLTTIPSTCTTKRQPSTPYRES